MLYTSGTTARPKGVPRRQRAERAAALAHVAQNLYGQRRAHARRHAALSHHGRALAHRHVADRRRLRLPAALRCRARARTDRGREDHQSLSGADALSRPLASRAIQDDRRQLGAQARLRRRSDDGWAAQGLKAAFKPDLFVNHYGSSEIYTFTIDQNARQNPARPAAPASTRWCAWCGSARRRPRTSPRRARKARSSRCSRAMNPSRATGGGRTRTPRRCATAGTSPATPDISTPTAICSSPAASTT